MEGCLECGQEQSALSDWGGLGTERLSEFISPELIQSTKRFILGKSPEQVWAASWQKVALKDVLRGSFARRFGVAEPDFRNKAHQYAVQRLGLSAMRMISAAEVFATKSRPECSFVASGDDFISASYLAALKKSNGYAIRFQWDLGSRAVRIYRGDDPQYDTCEILLDSISSVRSDISSWPEELIVLLDELAIKLGLSETQLELPIAQ
jgi:hypothetical protein